jgi:hypothetical protein
MKWLEFNNCLFETTGLVIRKFDSLSKDNEKDGFYLIVESINNGSQVKFNNEIERNDYYETIKNQINNWQMSNF